MQQTKNSNDGLYAMRHSLAHIMASAIKKHWPDVKLGVGPVIDNGFYYDIDLGETKLSEADFEKIESSMRDIITQDQKFEHFEDPIENAIKWAKSTNQPYKLELLSDLQRSGTTVASDLNSEELGSITDSASQVSQVSFYKNGDFTDLCRGPHVASTSKVGAFKLLRISGAYWRGKETNPQMQRLYGVAFDTKKELDDYLAMLEEAKKRDHRKLGQELDLFVVSDMVGSGLPLFTPKGTFMREQLADFSNELREQFGFEKVWTPHITKKELYETSGHWAKFGEELFLINSQVTSDQLVMKPMSCPHHTRIYASKIRSYRDLPIRYLETTTVYRDEKTGELGGLSRVRAITQDDSHVFCEEGQIEEEIQKLLEVAQKLYQAVDMGLRVRLSYRDESDVYLGDKSLWKSAQQQLKNAVVAQKLEFFEEIGEAAFYGPKIDFMATDALGREHQLATVQLDFVQPQRFGLEYVNDKGDTNSPVMIHCAVLGSIERFMSVYIEHTAGKFPAWLSPEQLRLITVNQEQETVDFADKIATMAKDAGLRVVTDNDNQSVGKKIRSAQLMQVPYSIVIGEKEIKSGQVTPRVRSDLSTKSEQTMPTEQFIKVASEDIKNRSPKSSV